MLPALTPQQAHRAATALGACRLAGFGVGLARARVVVRGERLPAADLLNDDRVGDRPTENIREWLGSVTDSEPSRNREG